MLPLCRTHWLGEVDYQAAWDLQNRLAQEIAAGERPASLLLLEHPHTYTFGRRGQAENLLWDDAQLERRGVKVYWVDRGGDVTYHGPGQLVGYPLLPLAPPQAVSLTSGAPRLPQADYIGYLRKLEQVLIETLAEFHLHARRITGLTGVWVPTSQGQAAKIAAIGVKVDAQGVTRHGFALNVAPDMSYWQGIVGCGLADRQVTCMADLLETPPSMPAVVQACTTAFGRVFGYRMHTAERQAGRADENNKTKTRGQASRS